MRFEVVDAETLNFVVAVPVALLAAALAVAVVVALGNSFR